MIIMVFILVAGHATSREHLRGVRRDCHLPFRIVVIDFGCGCCAGQQLLRRQEVVASHLSPASGVCSYLIIAV